jgi:nucleotide-binding universal stress UspA family protein
MEHSPTKVLLATDGSEDAALAARAAADISKGIHSELHVVHVLHPPSHYAYPELPLDAYSFVRDRQDRQAQELLAKEVKRIQDEGGNVAEVHLRRGPVADETLGLVRNLGADLMVVGSRGSGPVRRLVMGSVSEGLVHEAACPILVLRGGPDAWPPRRVIIGDDGSEAAKGAGELAARIGKLFEAEVLLVRVYPRLPDIDAEGRESDARMVNDELRREERALEDRVTEIERDLGVRPRIRIAVGDPAAVLLEAAAEGVSEKTLIAVGSRGLSAMQRVRLGSVSTKVLHAAEGPVLVYPCPKS